MSCTLNIVRKLFAVILALLVTGASSVAVPAYAKPIDTLLRTINPKKQEYENQLERRARDILNSQLDSGSYLMTLTTTLDTRALESQIKTMSSQVKIKSMGRTLGSDELVEQFATSMTTEDVSRYLKSVKIALKFDNKVSQNLESVLTSALEDSLGLNKKRGDSITIARVELSGGAVAKKYEEKIGDLERELNRARDEKRTLELKGTGLDTQKIQFDSQRIQFDTQRSQLEEQLRQARKDIDNEREAHQKTKNLLNELEEKTVLGKVRKAVRGIEMLVTFVPITIFVVLIGVVLGALYLSSQNRRSRTMLSGMQVVAEALTRAGSQVGKNSGGGRQPMQTVQAAELAAIAARRSDNDSGSSAMMSGGDGNLEAARAEAEARWALAQADLYPVFALLKEMLTTPEGAAKFMAFSASIGAENSKNLWQQFSPDDLQALTTGNIDVLSASQGYQLVTQVCVQAEAFRYSRPQWFANSNLMGLVKATDSLLVEAFASMPDEDIAFTLYLVPMARSSRLLTDMTGRDKRNIVTGLTRAASQPDSSARAKIDDINRRMTDLVNNQGSDGSALVGNIYKLADSVLKREISEAVMGDAQLATRLRGTIVTIRDVLGIDKDMLTEMLANFEVNDLSSFVFTLGKQEQQYVAGCLPRKMVFSVQQEIQRFSQRPASARQAQRVGEQVQSSLIEQVRAMAAEGLVELGQPQANNNNSNNQIRGNGGRVGRAS